MNTSIGSSLKASPGLMWLTALTAAILVGTDVAVVVFERYRLSLAIFGALFCAFVSAAQPAGGAAAFGFVLVPRQGWLFWIRVTFIVGAVLFFILLGFGIAFLSLGFDLPRPRLNRPSDFLPWCVPGGTAS